MWRKSVYGCGKVDNKRSEEHVSEKSAEVILFSLRHLFKVKLIAETIRDNALVRL